MDDRLFGNAFQIFEATVEKWFGGCYEWFYVEKKHIEKDEEERSARGGTYLGWEMKDRMAAEIGALLEVTVAILNLIFWRTGSQCKSKRTGVIWQNRGFCATTRARAFWISWRRVGFETDVSAIETIKTVMREMKTTKIPDYVKANFPQRVKKQAVVGERGLSVVIIIIHFSSLAFNMGQRVYNL